MKPSFSTIVGVASVVLCTCLKNMHVFGDMIDVIEPTMISPQECASGCMDWNDAPAVVWKDGKVPSDAGTYCAQPGAVVNSYPYGAWCYCSKAEPPKPPTPAAYYGTITDVDGYVTNGPLGLNLNTNGSAEFLWTWDHNSDGAKCVDADMAPYKWTEYPNGTVTATGNYYWFNGTASKNSAGERTYSGDLLNTNNAYCGAWNVLAGAPPQQPECKAGTSGYCTSPLSIPQQINIQIAAPDTVVISFVTFEPEGIAPADPPSVSIGTSTTNLKTVHGVTHKHETKPASGPVRTLYMHFISVSALLPRTTYLYSVKSGGANAVSSNVTSFRAPYSDGVTKIDIFGDMGIYNWNNMEWLEKDCASGTSADLIVHMGDHAYNEGENSELRADAYMQAYQPVLSQCPWMPIVGNHEYYSGTELSRYLDSTWEGWGTIPGGPSKSTSLGFLLGVGTHHGAATQGSTPSNTSRYFSVDFGLVHLIALDFNVYYGDDPCGQPCMDAQLKFLKEDLEKANANRDKVPWIIAMAHYPVYCTGCAGNGVKSSGSEGVSAEFYASSEAEYYGNLNQSASDEYTKSREKATNTTKPFKSLRGASDNLVADIQPIIQKYGLDFFLAGHWHYYESLWPGVTGTDECPACLQPTQKDFMNPKGTIHITTGNGGPPGKDNFREHCPGEGDCGSIAATRKQTTDYGYGQLIFHNATHAEFTQFENNNGTVFDNFMVTQEKHGPFV
eukprot:m.179559 g.179559  ORF g.179559 m.179559 type:complete len:727 (-) comp31979_c1_seq1:166-2346(-)